MFELIEFFEAMFSKDVIVKISPEIRPMISYHFGLFQNYDLVYAF